MFSALMHLSNYLTTTLLPRRLPWQLIAEDIEELSNHGVVHEIAWKYDAGMISVIFVPIVFSWLPL